MGDEAGIDQVKNHEDKLPGNRRSNYTITCPRLKTKAEVTSDSSPSSEDGTIISATMVPEYDQVFVCVGGRRGRRGGKGVEGRETRDEREKRN